MCDAPHARGLSESVRERFQLLHAHVRCERSNQLVVRNDATAAGFHPLLHRLAVARRLDDDANVIFIFRPACSQAVIQRSVEFVLR